MSSGTGLLGTGETELTTTDPPPMRAQNLTEATIPRSRASRLKARLAAPVATWRRVRPAFGDRPGRVALLVVVSVGAGLAEAGVLALVAAVAAAMVLHQSHVHTDLGPLALDTDISMALLVALGLSVVRLVLQLLVALLPASISSGVMARLRSGLFDAFTRASWSVQSAEAEGHVQELLTNQIYLATQIVTQIVGAVAGSMMFLALVVAAMSLSLVVASTVLATAIVLFWLLRPIAFRGARAGRDLSRTSIEQAHGFSEAVSLAEETQVFGVSAGQRQVVGSLIEDARRAFFRFVFTGGVVTSVYQSVVILLILGGLAGLYLTGARDIASLGAVVLMLVRASTYAQQFQGGYTSLRQVMPYFDRLQAAVAKYQASVPRSGNRPLRAVNTVSFENVTFSYSRGEPVLRGVSFEVSAGESIGIVGGSGAGKSTLAQILLRLREPGSGEYLINGEAAWLLRPDDFRRRFAYVSQEPRLMHASVAENIRFLREIDDAAIARAARLAHIEETILGLPNGYDTIIGQRADAVSGGQRQRLCLARALAGEPDVLVLDEPTSALDMASEAAVQASLSDLQGRVTLFVIAHRISTLSQCDRVMVLADGVIETIAPLAEIESSSAYYRATAALARGSA